MKPLKNAIIGIIAFCTVFGMIEDQTLEGIVEFTECVESEFNVCCKGQTHPLLIQDAQHSKFGRKIFTPEEIKLLK